MSKSTRVSRFSRRYTRGEHTHAWALELYTQTTIRDNTNMSEQ